MIWLWFCFDWELDEFRSEGTNPHDNSSLTNEELMLIKAGRLFDLDYHHHQ